MESKIKCSLEEHKEKDVTKYCPECKIYMCKKCENHHSSPIFKNHHPYDINNDDINYEKFNGFCKEKNHSNKLEYYCKNHNQLCCDLCLCKLNDNNKGQHKDCDVCHLDKIKDEKKNKLEENIINLDNLHGKLNEKLESLKNICEQLEKNKENLKLEVQNTFTKIRNALNNREDEILLEIDNLFNTKIINEDVIMKGEKLKKQIKLSLEKGKLIVKDWKDNILISNINDCINNINIINIRKNFLLL